MQRFGKPGLMLFLFMALWGVAGCQSYSPLPLNLDDHQRQWEARDVHSEGVRTYAEDLAKRDDGRRKKYDPSDGLTLQEAEAVALFFNASLRTRRLESSVSLAGAVEAGRWKDPELEVDGGIILASISQPWFAAAAIRFTIPLSGRPGVEQDKAYAKHREEWASVAAAEWEVLTKLRREWVQLAVVRQKRVLAEEQKQSIEKVRDSAKALFDAGRVSATELRAFEIEVVRQDLSIRELEYEESIQVSVVLGVLGLVPTAPIDLTTETNVPLEVPTDVVQVMRERNPKLALKRAEYDVAEQHLRLEVRKQYPDLTIGPGYEIEEGQSRIGIGFGLPIPIINLNRRGIAEAKANRLAAKSGFEGEYERLVGEVAVAQKELRLATDVRQSIQGDLIPLADIQVRDVMELGELDRLDVVLVLEALRIQYDSRIQLVDARQREALANIKLAELVGPTYEGVPAPKAE